MYFGHDHNPSCDENCTNCGNTGCLDHPRRTKALRDDWEGEPRKCAFCGETFIPTKPAQRYCSPEENPECDYERAVNRMTPLQYVRFHGYRTKEDFIRDNGQDAWDAIQKQ